MQRTDSVTPKRPATRRGWRGLMTLALVGSLAAGGLNFSVPTGPQTAQHITLGSEALAQSGGGFGGRSGGSSSSGGGYSGGGGGYSGGGYSGGGYSGGGYSGGPIIINGGGWGGGYGGYYGGGGFGLVPIIIFGVVIFMVVGGMRRAMSGGQRGLTSPGGSSLSGTAQAVSVQILMAEGDEVKAALQRIAQNGDPDTNEGLARMLQEAALVALRHPERWVYGNVERAQGAANAADSQVGAWATEARAAFTDQTTSNYQNNDPRTGHTQRTDYRYSKDAGDMYLAVTIAVAAHALGNLPPAGVTTAAEARAALSAISSVNPDDLIRAEVIWSPDAEGEFLSEDEAIVKYPKLTKL